MEKTYTIDLDPDGGLWVHSHDEYPENSVLAGQYRRCKCKHFDTLDEAKEEYPQAEVTNQVAFPMDWIRPTVPSYIKENGWLSFDDYD